MLNGMATTPCLIPRCRMFAASVGIDVICYVKVNPLIPDQVVNAKTLIQKYL